jgi:hypothetical protein
MIISIPRIVNILSLVSLPMRIRATAMSIRETRLIYGTSPRMYPIPPSHL